MKRIVGDLPGIIIAVAIAVPAWLLGKMVPVIGGPVLGILFGMVLAGWNRPAAVNAGIQFTSKKLLQAAIILLGFEMNLFSILTVGRQTLFLMLFTLSGAFITTALAGRLLGMGRNAKILIGVGSAICGGSAIAATAPVIGANDDEIAHSISTIFLFNVVAAFLFPVIGHALNMSDQLFGLWAGTAVNDTSSVVAAGFSYSDEAGQLAVIVKLTRTLMIIPITLALAFYTSKQAASHQTAKINMLKIFPWFVLGFITAAVMNTFVPAMNEAGSILAQLGKFGIVMAMAAIGLNTNLIRLVTNGTRPILLGLISWLSLSLISLGTLFAIGNGL